ncbi:MAG: thiamine diphosphokinase [Acidimicrobiia bacterium]
MRTAVIVAGGDPVPAEVLEDLPGGAWVVAADSGADHARSLGLDVDVIVGDLDSITPATLAAFPEAEVHSHPVDKDATDLELAIALVSDTHDIDRVVVIGGTGGRLDHFLANAMALAAPRFSHLDIVWIAHPGRATIVHRHARLHGSVGDQISLVPVGGDVVGVRTTGLRWALDGDDLPFGTSRGVSNTFSSSVAAVTIESGVLLVVQPVG